MKNKFIDIDDFAVRSIAELEESFVAEYKTFKEQHSHFIAMCNITYDDLCKRLLIEFSNVLYSHVFGVYYKEEAERVVENLEIFKEIYDDILIEETHIQFYTQIYNHAYFRAALVIQNQLGKLYQI